MPPDTAATGPDRACPSPSGPERRIGPMVLAYWDECRSAGGKPDTLTIPPPRHAIDLAHPRLRDFLYLVRWTGRGDEATIEHCGGALSAFSGKTATGERVGSLLPRETAREWLGFLKVAASQHRPLANSGVIEQDGAFRLLYRNIIMPLQPEGETCWLLGALSFCRQEAGEALCPGYAG